MARVRVLLLSPFTDGAEGARHSDIRGLLEGRACEVVHQRTSGTYAIRPDSDFPGAIEVAGQRRDQTPTTFITEKMDRRRRRAHQTQEDVRRRVLLAAQQLRDVDCVVAEVTTQCLQLGMLIERARVWGKPVLCLRRPVVQLPLLPLLEEHAARITLREYSTPEMLEAVIQAFLVHVTRRDGTG